jgi:hypothetical protein
MKINQLVYICCLFIGNLASAAPNTWYLHGTFGAANQMNWYRKAPNKEIHLQLKHSGNELRQTLATKFQVGLQNSSIDQLPEDMQALYKRFTEAVTWGDLVTGGIGYQKSSTFSIEVGGMRFYSPIKPVEDPESLQWEAFSLDASQEKIKITALRGFNITGKKIMFLMPRLYGYAQLGLGVWLYNQAENEEIAKEIVEDQSMDHEALHFLAAKVPIIPSLLPGLGLQIKLNAYITVDIAWIYSMQFELSPFHMIKVGLKF